MVGFGFIGMCPVCNSCTHALANNLPAGITLPNDPEPQFGIDATSKAQSTDISLSRVLSHFQEELFAKDLPQFAVLGFNRYNPYVDMDLDLDVTVTSESVWVFGFVGAYYNGS